MYLESYKEISKPVLKTNHAIKKRANDLDTSLKKMMGIVGRVGNANKTAVKHRYAPFRRAQIMKTDHTKG